MEFHQVIISIRKIIRSINLESKRIQKNYGLSLPQLLVLSFINAQPTKRAQAKHLKDYLNLNASTVTGIVLRLERKGYLEKIAHESDRRSYYVMLTSQGKKLIDQAPTTIQERLSTKLQLLTPHELDDLQRSLALLTKIMSIEDLEAASVLSLEEDLGN